MRRSLPRQAIADAGLDVLLHLVQRAHAGGVGCAGSHVDDRHQVPHGAQYRVSRGGAVRRLARRYLVLEVSAPAPGGRHARTRGLLLGYSTRNHRLTTMRSPWYSRTLRNPPWRRRGHGDLHLRRPPGGRPTPTPSQASIQVEADTAKACVAAYEGSGSRQDGCNDLPSARRALRTCAAARLAPGSYRATTA